VHIEDEVVDHDDLHERTKTAQRREDKSANRGIEIRNSLYAGMITRAGGDGGGGLFYWLFWRGGRVGVGMSTEEDCDARAEASDLGERSRFPKRLLQRCSNAGLQAARDSTPRMRRVEKADATASWSGTEASSEAPPHGVETNPQRARLHSTKYDGSRGHFSPTAGGHPTRRAGGDERDIVAAAGMVDRG